MKRIIDIDEDYYENLKYNVEQGQKYKPWEIIVNSTPYEERPQGEFKKYKPLEPDYNVQCAVENLRTAYWSNEPEKVAKVFTEADEMIVSAICHYGYSVYKQQQGEWIDYSNEGYVECPFCHEATNCEDNKDELHYCWNCGAAMGGEKNGNQN